MKQNLKDDGSWSAVVYWLRRRGVYSRRSALRSKNLTTTRIYREYSWACLKAAARLEVKILEVAFAEEIDRADNPELSAHSCAYGEEHATSRPIPHLQTLER